MTLNKTVAIHLLFFSAWIQFAGAEVVLPSVIGSNMVLQRNQPVPIWGRAAPGEKVVVEFGAAQVETSADAEGNWSVALPPMEASFEPATLTVIGENKIELTNILIGEVWVCSGQSNMEFPLSGTHDAALELAAANYPNLRLFDVDNQVAETPRLDCAGGWELTTPESARSFSAVGYFLGRNLLLTLDVPVGLIHSSWGGTPAEAWTRIDALNADEVTRPIVEQWSAELENYPERLAQWQQELDRLNEAARLRGGVCPADSGVSSAAARFNASDFDDSSWQVAVLPETWETQIGEIDGAVWLRKTIVIPDEWTGQELLLETGPIDDFDITWFNGTEVGRYTRLDGYQVPRSYRIPAGLVQSGRAVIAIRVFDVRGGGGVVGEKNQLKLSCPGRAEPLMLAGPWKIQVEYELTPADRTKIQNGPQKPRSPDSPHRPASLANGMLGPIVPFAIRGAIWYQGEANAGRHEQYRTLLPVMICDWWSWWGQGSFPFGIVQLANFMPVKAEPSDDDWAYLRDAQFETAKNMPEAGLAVAIDLGERDDIHPRNKQDVGARLARWALADVYGMEITASGPIYQSSTIEGNHILCTFDHVANGLEVREGGALNEFIIVGKEGVWKWAQAQIVGKNQIKVWSDEVKEPVAVRYAWASNPASPNLVNSEDLSASPFRTDSWTQGVINPSGEAP